ncbi:MAG: hypothetical protein IKX23_09740 [Treponema sp.]|nr:hypothetical protein [Treponema sp.]
MKKIIMIIAAALCLCGAVSALDFTIDGNILVPVTKWREKNSVGTDPVKTVKSSHSETGIGFDITGKVMFTRMFGAQLSFDILLPLEHKERCRASDLYDIDASYGYTATLINKWDLTKWYNGISAFNIFAGCVINVYNTREFFFQVIPGFIFQNYTCKDKVNNVTVSGSYRNFGISVEADATYYLTKQIYVNAALPLTWLFYTEELSENKGSGIHKFYTAPKIGAGYKFDF